MSTLILAVISLLLYSLGTLQQLLLIRGHTERSHGLTLGLGALALLAHATLTVDLIWVEAGFNLSLTETLVLITALIVALVLAISTRRPLDTVLVIAYPVAITAILAAMTYSSHPRVVAQSAYGVLTHVALAMTAYSLFALAAIQALLLHVQNRQLKAHRQGPIIRALPPLQTMESTLFGLLRAGVLLLTLAIVTGAIFMDDFFSQGLAHKTVFSLLAWVVFTALLVGHQVQGWRGAVASRWTLAGCIFLTLGYHGSRLVLEFMAAGQ